MSNMINLLHAVNSGAKYPNIFFFLHSVVGELIHYQSNTKELQDGDKNTPLHLACMNGYLEVAKMLLAPHLLLKKYVNSNC